jgi:hypothetical protein
MPITAEERTRMMEARSIGPRMVSHLELVGIERLCDLKGRDPRELAFEINAHLGHPRINSAGVQALSNLVALADGE